MNDRDNSKDFEKRSQKKRKDDEWGELYPKKKLSGCDYRHHHFLLR
jgi:hypothetical protein